MALRAFQHDPAATLGLHLPGHPPRHCWPGTVGSSPAHGTTALAARRGDRRPQRQSATSSSGCPWTTHPAEGAWDLANAADGGGESGDAHHTIQSGPQAAGNWLGDTAYTLINGDDSSAGGDTGSSSAGSSSDSSSGGDAGSSDPGSGDAGSYDDASAYGADMPME